VGKEIAISATSLAPGDYTKNISIGGYSSNEVTAHNPKDIQALIHVNECTASVPSCFFTDSAGEFLSNCSGDLVSTNDGGVFQLVNKKTGQITATNPGQFYYNYIWTNDGPAIDVQINFGNPQNLVPKELMRSMRIHLIHRDLLRTWTLSTWLMPTVRRAGLPDHARSM
jgi:hypothetical protein